MRTVPSSELRVVYLPIGRRTFDMESARAVYGESLQYLRGLGAEVAGPESIITSVQDLQDTMAGFSESPDLVVFQMTTFADADFVRRASERYAAPFLVWSVREPEVGGTLRLNSLTGGNSSCHFLHDHDHTYSFVYGNPDEAAVREAIERQVRVRRVMRALSELTVGVVGDAPPGFFFSDTDAQQLHATLGARLHRINLETVFAEAEKLPESVWRPVVEEASSWMAGIDPNDERTAKFARVTAWLREYCDRHDIGATTIRNWPEFFAEYDAAADAVLSWLTETGIPSANEGDVHGAISMYVQYVLAGTPAYLGDLVRVDESENTFTFWHDGAGAPSLANGNSGAQAGVHPNRKIGLTVEMGLKPGPVTITRLGRTRGGFRLLVMRGEALDAPQQFAGTSVVVRLDVNASEALSSLMTEGWEPHYSLVYGDFAEDLKELGRQLRIEVREY